MGLCVAIQGAAIARPATINSSNRPRIRVGCLRIQRQRRPLALSASCSTMGAPDALVEIELSDMMVPCGGSVADTRIEQPVAEVDQQIDQHVSAGR
ncbi:hypothetical protein D9M68_706580 [compost metagenome]